LRCCQESQRGVARWDAEKQQGNGECGGITRLGRSAVETFFCILRKRASLCRSGCART
jgi:hypothetical protein